MDKQQVLFAFRLADATREARLDHRASDPKWKAQDGVAVAGCTDYRFPGNVRSYSQIFGNDRGLYC